MNNHQPSRFFTARYKELKKRWNNSYHSILEESSFKSAPSDIQKCILYILEAGGKRVRAVLLLEVASILGVSDKIALECATSCELIHTYSLIHDDLPAIDNDDTRRGKPSCHIAFGEDVAILAGNVLHSLAYEILAWHGPSKNLLITFSRLVGGAGLIGGEYHDIRYSKLLAQGAKNDPEIVNDIAELKTGALFCLTCTLPCYILGSLPVDVIALETWGEWCGVLFQMADDILDYRDITLLPNGLAETNYVDVYGLEGTIAEMEKLEEKMGGILPSLFIDSPILTELPKLIISQID